jgi:hypothetical protein
VGLRRPIELSLPRQCEAAGYVVSLRANSGISNLPDPLYAVAMDDRKNRMHAALKGQARLCELIASSCSNEETSVEFEQLAGASSLPANVTTRRRASRTRRPPNQSAAFVLRARTLASRRDRYARHDHARLSLQLAVTQHQTSERATKELCESIRSTLSKQLPSTGTLIIRIICSGGEGAAVSVFEEWPPSNSPPSSRTEKHGRNHHETRALDHRKVANKATIGEPFNLI